MMAAVGWKVEADIVGVDYVQSRNCKVKRELGVDVLVSRIKARGQAAMLVERIRSELGMRDIITAYGMTECVNITGCRPGE